MNEDEIEKGCTFELFDTEKFKSCFKGKSIAFVGDSLSRNQYQSLSCLLDSPSSYGNMEPEMQFDEGTSKFRRPEENLVKVKDVDRIDF